MRELLKDVASHGSSQTMVFMVAPARRSRRCRTQFCRGASTTNLTFTIFHDGPEQHQQIQKRTFRPNAKTTRNKNTLSMKMARVRVEYLLDSNSHHFFAAEVYKIGLGTRLVCTFQNTSYCSVYSSACTSGLLRP